MIMVQYPIELENLGEKNESQAWQQILKKQPALENGGILGSPELGEG